MAVGIDKVKPPAMGWPITPSDTTVFVEPTKAICIGVGGNLVVWQLNPETGKFAAITHAVQAGVFVVETNRVMAATTATGLSALA